MINISVEIVFLTFLAISSMVSSEHICNIHCDERDPALASGPLREALVLFPLDRRVVLRVSDQDNMAYGMIIGGEPGDEVWVDRTFNGGLTYSNETRTGDVQIPANSTIAMTPMFNIDDPSTLRIGALRVCVILNGQTNQNCTAWARSTVNAGNKLDAAVTAMMMYYESWRGLWKTVGWWNGANDMTVLIDYQLLTGSRLYEYAINNTFELNKDLNEFGGYNFTSDSIDDSLWWGLAWLKAFDLTGDQKYLTMAATIADYCYQFHDDVCGGGMWWSDRRQYKNAVTNEQYIKIAVQLHNRIPGDTKYLTQSVNLWNWFRYTSGMINEENLINDGLHECKNNGGDTWTYNQGIILGALAELYQATGNLTYITEARKIADAVIRSSVLNDQYGILWEPCFESEPDCGPNAPCFKGIFIRNLGELDRIIQERPYTSYILKQAESIYAKNRTPLDQYGLFWSGPVDFPDASRQQSAVDALLAAEIASQK